MEIMKMKCRNMNKYLILFVAAGITSLSTVSAHEEKKDSTIVLPWGVNRSYWQTTGSFLQTSGSALDGKPVGDVRNRLTGVIPGLEVIEVAGGTHHSGYATYTLNTSTINLNMRGGTDLMCIVDDMYIPLSQLMLEPNQIESITVLADVVDKAKFGPLASNGALYIKTKKGGYNTPMRISVNTEAGISMATKVAEYVNGVEYAKLNNQARQASGYETLYSDDHFQGFAANDPYSLLYPNVDYKSLMYRNFYPISNVGLNLSGGTGTIKYSLALNGLYSGDLIVGGTVNDDSKFNISASVTTKIGRYLEVGIDFTTMLSFDRGGRVNWNDWRKVPAVAFPLSLGANVGGADEEGRIGTEIYPLSRTFTTNYYALLKEGGFNTSKIRTGYINAHADLNMSFILPGLKSRTWIASTSCLQTSIGKNDDYLAYFWEPDKENARGEITSHKGAKSSSKSLLSKYSVQSLAVYERLSYDKTFGKNNMSSGVTLSLNNTATKASDFYQRQLYLIGDISYSYANKYIAEFAIDYAGSSRFAEHKRYAALPAVGLAWVASNEGFLKNAKWIDNLKLRAQTGLIGRTNIFGEPFLYRGDYSFSNGMWYGPLSAQDSWFGVNRFVSQKTTINRYSNPDLTWEKLFDIEAGIDFDFLQMFSFKASGYFRRAIGTIANVASAIPMVFGVGGNLYDNYTSNQYMGLDLSLSWHRRFGDFNIGLSASASSWEVRYRKLVSDEYLYDYQRLTGRPTDRILGYSCIGKYETEDQIRELPSYGSDLQIGDLIYLDKNNDGKIDTKDRSNLGNSNPRLRYAVNLDFGWKNLEFHLTGTGRALYKVYLTNEFFWNGWGDGNYSAFVRDNIGGAYPRLSYAKSQNNFILSDFWLSDGHWFKIQDIELAYTLNLNKKKGIQSMRFNVKGQNLATFTKVPYIDPEAPAAGVSSYPLLRTITAGVKMNF